MTRVHAFGDDSLGDLDAVGLVGALGKGEVSLKELVEDAIARAEQVDPALGAIAYRAYDAARNAALSPPSGWFAGLPTFLKDMVDVEGQPTMNGSDAYVGRPAKADGDLARMVKATGLVSLGRTRVPEWGLSASTEHPRLGSVANPWNTAHTAGGSSSGAAALVAAGVVPLTHAMDGGGSTRIPASATGLVGLKPTRARLAQDKTVRSMPIRIVADGVLTRSVRDTAAFYREAEKAYRNPKLAPIGDLTRPGTKRLKVAVITSSAGGRRADAEVRDLTLSTAALLEELGHQVEEIAPPVPDFFVTDFLVYWSTLANAVARTGRLTFGSTWDSSRLEPITRGLSSYSTRNAWRLPLALVRLRAAAAASARFFSQYDVALSPTVAHATPELGHLAADQPFEQLLERLMTWVAFTPLANATGDPAISLPLAQTANGMPLGMMFGAGAGREATLIGLAYELEQARPFARIQDATV
jgi:amidase